MALAPLATVQELADRMGTAPDPARATAVLTDVSAAIRAYTGQMFNRMTTTEHLRARCCGRLRLPQRPVNSITAVVATLDDTVLAYAFDGVDRLALSPAVDLVTVTYDHGYPEGGYPGEIVALTCAVAARTLATPPEDAGVTQRSITNYSESFGPVGAAGSAGLFNDERRVLDRYRRPGATARVACP
jgi:hypothetical protein